MKVYVEDVILFLKGLGLDTSEFQQKFSEEIVDYKNISQVILEHYSADTLRLLDTAYVLSL